MQVRRRVAAQLWPDAPDPTGVVPVVAVDGDGCPVAGSWAGGDTSSDAHTLASLTSTHGADGAPSRPRTWAMATTEPSRATWTTGSAVASPRRCDT